MPRANNKKMILIVTGVMLFLMVSSLAAFGSMTSPSASGSSGQLQGDILVDVRCGNQTYPVSVDSRYFNNESKILLGDQECEIL